MGARWAWYARCGNGHIYSNFSGGPDDACYECGASPVDSIDCQHFWNGADCDCKVALAAKGE